MAVLTGNNGQITVGGTTVLNVRNFSVDIKADTIETTTMGVDARTYLKGLSSWSGSADIYLDTANLTGGASVIAGLIATGGVVGDSTAAVVLSLDVVGSPSNKKFSGNAIITGFSVKSSMDGLVEASISLQGSGAVTWTL